MRAEKSRGMSGPKAHYRGKLRQRPLSFTLTPEGHAALASGQRSTGLSRSDYVEKLLREAARRQPSA